MAKIMLPKKHHAADVTIFTKMSALATQYGAINLSQGFPDFDIDEKLSALLGAAAKEGYNQYAPMAGWPTLKEAIAADISARYNTYTDPEQVTVTPGATYGLYVSLASIITPGDAVIILEPAYDSYIPAIEMNGGIAVPVPLNVDDFTVNWERVVNALLPNTKAIIINTPHNPTGSVWTATDIDTLAEIAERHNLIVISDEVYEQLVYDGQEHFSVWQNERLRERCLVVYSFGKVILATGWKMGYVLANELLTQAYRRVHQYLTFSVNAPAQYALAKYLALNGRPNLREQLQNKRDYFFEQIQHTPFKAAKKAAGGFFQVMSYEGFSKLPDTEFADWLTKEKGVATIPMSAFYHNGSDEKSLRFCFTKKEATLQAAMERLQQL